MSNYVIWCAAPSCLTCMHLQTADWAAHVNPRVQSSSLAHTHTCACRHNASVFMVCGQPISGTKALFAFHLKEISGFAQRQPNLDISNKAHLLPPSPLCSALCLCCTYICTFACSLRKKQFSSKSPSCEKRGLLRLATEGTELVGNWERGAYVWERSLEEA